MFISNSITSPVSRPAAQRPAPAAQKDSTPTEVFDRPSEALMTIYARNPEALKSGARIATGVVGLAAGAGIGAFAGSHTGVLAGIAGAATLALPGALIGAVGVGVLAEKLGTSGSDTAGAAIAGGVLGAVGSMVAGAYIGSQIAGPIATIGLALAGGVAGAFYAAT